MSTNPLAGKPTFGAGRVFGIGNYTNPTPTRPLVPQSQSIDFKRKTESLFGENQLAVAVGAGEMDVTGKVEFGKINARVYSDLLFADPGAVGSNAEADGELQTVPAAGPYTVSALNAASFLFDLGVTNVATGAIYSRVQAGSEVAGASYSVVTSGANAGKYTFAAGDTNANVKISYAYKLAAVGESITLTNQLQGLTGGFQAVHVLPWGTEQDMFVLNNCIASSAGISAKKSGFGSNMLEYIASTDAFGNLGTASFAEAA